MILHEMAHMWFGDLVTMKWWDDLWLNESFAEWACYHAAVEATEFTESWTGFTNARKNWALRQDQLPSTHPIAADNFDLAGGRGELRRHHLRQGRLGAQAAGRLGRPGQLPRRPARATSRTTPSRTPSSPTCSAALEEASGRELDSWAKEWLQTSGVNTLAPEFELDADGTYASFAVRQSAAAEHPTLRRHRIGIGLYDDVRRPPGASTRVEIDVEGELTEVAELVGERQPDLLLLNDGDLTYAKIRLDERSLATVVERPRRRSTTRWRGRCAGAPRGT